MTEKVQYKQKGKYERDVCITHTMEHAYNKYLEKHHVKYTKRKYSKADFIKFMFRVNTLLATKIITESFELKIPRGLGILCIRKSEFKIPIDKDGKLKKHKLLIDWDATWDYWYTQYGTTNRKEIAKIPDKQLVYNYNQHTDGYIMKWKWEKSIAPIKNKSVYTFKPTKGGVLDEEVYYGRLGLGKWIKNPIRDNDYYEIKRQI